ncbi:MAG: hypothetical protein ACREB3_10700, partial [Burkholderiales bacterium]
MKSIRIISGLLLGASVTSLFSAVAFAQTEVAPDAAAEPASDAASQTEFLQARAEALQAQRLHFESDAGHAEIAAARSDADAARRAREQSEETLAGARRLEAAETESDAFASHMVALLDHGEAIGLQAGYCPLCDAVRRSEEFAAAIAAARFKLSARGRRAAQAALGLEQARLAAQQAEASLTAAEQRLAVLEARRNSLSADMASVASTFGQWSLAAPPAEPETARRLMLLRQEETAELERALFILEASSAHDRVTALEGRVEQLRVQVDDETAKLTSAQRAVEAARQIDNAAKEVRNQVLTEQFDTVMPLLKELYQRLRPHTDWREIEI